MAFINLYKNVLTLKNEDTIQYIYEGMQFISFCLEFVIFTTYNKIMYDDNCLQ